MCAISQRARVVCWERMAHSSHGSSRPPTSDAASWARPGQARSARSRRQQTRYQQSLDNPQRRREGTLVTEAETQLLQARRRRRRPCRRARLEARPGTRPCASRRRTRRLPEHRDRCQPTRRRFAAPTAVTPQGARGARTKRNARGGQSKQPLAMPCTVLHTHAGSSHVEPVGAPAPAALIPDAGRASTMCQSP